MSLETELRQAADEISRLKTVNLKWYGVCAAAGALLGFLVGMLF